MPKRYYRRGKEYKQRMKEFKQVFFGSLSIILLYYLCVLINYLSK